MARKSPSSARISRILRPTLVAFVAVTTIGASGIAMAGATTVSPVTICINKATGRVHISSSGLCLSIQTRINLGIGAGGNTGPAGPTGGTGGTGPSGGPQGVQGIQGMQGVQGPQGVQGIQGVVGGSGGTGGVGGTGGIGGTGPVGGTGGIGGTGGLGGTGGTGPLGGTGGTGPAGANTFTIVNAVVNNSPAVGAAIALCGAGRVTTGGGVSTTGTVVVTDSGPAAAGASWTVSYTGGTGTFSVTAHAICAAGTETP